MSLKLEGFFYGADKTKLHYKYWPRAEARKWLIITHGQAEHGGCYQRLVDAIKSSAVNIVAWDLRGHGKSDGQRGFVKTFQDYIDDLASFVEFLKNESSLKYEDVFLLGHSMGGLVQLSYLTQNSKKKFSAQILSSPLLGFSVEVPLFKDIAALVAKALLPQLTLFNEIDFEDLTSDEAVIREMRTDVLRHDRISPAAYLGAIEAIQSLRTEISKIHIPTLIQIPTNDPVVDSQSNREFFGKIQSPQKELKEYPDRKHEIYNDIGRELVIGDLVSYLEKFVV